MLHTPVGDSHSQIHHPVNQSTICVDGRGQLILVVHHRITPDKTKNRLISASHKSVADTWVYVQSVILHMVFQSQQLTVKMPNK